MTKTKAITIRKEDWYQGLIKDLMAIRTEKVFIIRDELLEMKWMTGHRILIEKDRGITAIIKYVAFDTGFSEREMWRCVEFTRQWPGKTYQHATEVKPLPEGKNCSWHKMANKYLPSAGGGSDHYESEWNKRIKNLIKERDDYICQICKRKKYLAIHHIDHNKKNCDLNNLITVCQYCHSKTDYNREKWIKLFSRLVINNCKEFIERLKSNLLTPCQEEKHKKKSFSDPIR